MLVFLWSYAVCHRLSCRDLLVSAALRGSCEGSRKWTILGTKTELDWIYHWFKPEARGVLPGINLFHNNLIPIKEGSGWILVCGQCMKPSRLDSEQSGKWGCAPRRKNLVGCHWVIWPVPTISSSGGERSKYKIQISLWGVVLDKREGVILQYSL